MSSSAQECSGMENDRGDGAAKLTKSQRKRKRQLLKKKLHASSESSDKRKDVENPKSEPEDPRFYIISMSSLQDKPNTGLGTAANVDQTKTVPIAAATGDVKSLISRSEGYGEIAEGEGHGEIAKGEKGSSRATAVDVKTGSTREEYMETANGMRSSSRNTTLDAIGTHDSKSRVSKREQNLKIANDETVSSEIAIIDANRKSKRKEYMETASGETVSGKLATPDAKTVSKGEEQTKVADGEVGSITTTNLNVVDRVENKKKRSRGKKPPSGEVLNAPHLEDMKTAIDETDSGTTATDNTASIKRKRQKSKNKIPASGDILSTCGNMQDMVIAKHGSSTTKVIESRSGEMVSGKPETPDAKMGSKGEEHTKPVNGNMGLSVTSNLNVNGTVKETKKLKSKNGRPTIGEISTPKCLQDMETANGETGSITIATEDAASKKERGQKRVGLKNKKPASGNILSAGENTQDRVIAKKDSDTNNILEAKITDSKEDCPNIVNGEKCRLIVKKGLDNNDVLEARSTSSKREDYLNTNNVETGLVTIVKDDAASAKGKRQRGVRVKNKKPASGDILSNGESTLDTVITKRDLDANNFLEAKSTDSGGEDCPIIVNGEKCMVIVKKDSDINNVLERKSTDSKREDYLKTANSVTGSVTVVTDDAASKKRKRQRGVRIKNKKPASGDILSNGESTQDTLITEKDLDTNNVVEAKSTEPEYRKMLNGKKPTVGEVLNPEYQAERASSQKILRERKKNQAMGLNADENTEVTAINEITHVATSGKKLLVFDVNGLIADVVYPKPKYLRAHISIRKRAIFKRPFLDDFLRFCFERFDVAIWSSRRGGVLKPVVHCLLRGLKDKLLFLWDISKCTKTQTRTLGSKHKCIVFKDLRKIWQKSVPGCSWVKGTYHESNTLLVDDSPYKALLNPKHTGIFPVSYSYQDRYDDSLGPNGDLRTYLEGLAAADDVKTYVKQHPFGQGEIDETHPDWAFYSQVVGGMEESGKK